jgi:enoyl reductase-like protein
MESKKLTYEEYIEKCIDEAEIEEKSTTKRYTLEESHAKSMKRIEELEKNRESKRYAS